MKTLKHENIKTTLKTPFEKGQSFNVLRFLKFNDQGFTLVETLIYIAIIGGAIMAFISFALSVSGNRNKTYVMQEVQANSRVVLDVISDRIKNASGVNTSTSVFGADPGVLSLSYTSSTLNPTIIQLSRDNGTLQIIEGIGDPINITSNEVQVTNLVFTNLTNRASRENIRVEMTIDFASSTNKEFEYSQNLQTSVSVRR